MTLSNEATVAELSAHGSARVGLVDVVTANGGERFVFIDLEANLDGALLMTSEKACELAARLVAKAVELDIGT